ncbi:hypothetical protein [Shewanella sp. OMA3-2]|uniref:hypothetical protein n=1 Tax=Shewanella sp. OMA3-2 TaxID=2908650 RepID=UPI001F47634D|nr:hypothetical protein [Shewanella sp. OMA3-2]UJF21185.1 hypothetical protein L0B17_13715 [Shewanella sp. OMA3-2]
MNNAFLLQLYLVAMLFSVSAMAAGKIDANAQTTVTKSTQAEPTQKISAAKTNQPVLIESKVTGSQEQPKVLYIMPWQGITNPISVDNNDMKLALPQFKPIHPKVFQQQVRDFTAPIETNTK